MIYISNTIQMSNPLYAINCRPQGPSFIEDLSNKKYIKYINSIVDI